MSGLSRRDGLMEAVGSMRAAMDQVQQQAQAQAQAQQGGGGSHPTTANSNGSNGSSTTSPTSPRMRNSQSLNGAPNQIADYLSRMGSALQAGPLNGASSSSNRRSPYTCLGPVDPPPPEFPSSSRQSFEAAPDERDGDDLPDYAPRRDGVAQPVRYLHSLTSSSKKIELVLESVGTKTHPVYVENLCPTVKGIVRFKTGGDESVNELRIRIKGVVTTSLKRSQASTRGMAEEVEFWYASSLLWTATDEQPTLDLKKETHEFPFSLSIPPVVPTGMRIRETYKMPPSFVLSAAFTDASGVDTASVRYYVKVTLARRGLLKQNDRLFAPCVYLNRANDLSWLSDARRAWLVQQIPLRGPLEARKDWEGRMEDKEIRKGFLARKHFNFKVALLLPRPLTYGKIETLPFYIKLSSTNESMLEQFGLSSLYVGLCQRTIVYAAGTPAVHETAIVKGQTELVTEPIGEVEADPSIHVKRFRGTLQLNKAPSTTFKSYNLEVGYFVLVNHINPSTGAAQETLVQVPVTILSIPPVSRHAAEVQRANASIRTQTGQGNAVQSQPAAQSQQPMSPMREEPDDLPPSYFDVVEPERRQ